MAQFSLEISARRQLSFNFCPSQKSCKIYFPGGSLQSLKEVGGKTAHWEIHARGENSEYEHQLWHAAFWSDDVRDPGVHLVVCILRS